MRRPTPLTVVTDVRPEAMAATVVGLQWDLPGAVSVHHSIDPDAQVLTRVVSDVTGELERASIELAHACVGCALREDVVPTLERLARTGRWSSILSCLPTGAEADQLTAVLAMDTRLARHLRLVDVVAVLESGTVVDDLLGDAQLRDIGGHDGPDDERGVGEVACAMVECADVVVTTDDPGREAGDLLLALMNPRATLVHGPENLPSSTPLRPRHDAGRTRAWTTPTRTDDLPDLGPSLAWRLDLRSEQPVHPGRLLEHIERLGTGPYRSRGCFGLLSRPGLVHAWDGAGGQLSVGTHGPARRSITATRLVFTGLGRPPADLAAAFDDVLARPSEPLPALDEDGLEPWLGPVRRVA